MTTAAQQKEEDDLYNMAVTIVRTKQRVGVTILQRKLHIGYNRAAHLIERMEKEKVVSELKTHGSREVLEDDENLFENIKPNTLDGIKQLAKKIKKGKAVKHNEALELAAKQAGFETFQHARNSL